MTANKENIRAWVDALRSGEYGQARQALARVRGQKVTYCCLGVASEISGVCNTRDGRTAEGGWKLRTYDGESGSLPRRVRAWLGLNDPFPTLENGTSLASLNDGGKSFAEIADLIEAEWLS